MRRGHAVVGIKMPGANKVQKITIIPRGQAGGYNLMTPEEEKYNLTKKELIAMITSFMGGRVCWRNYLWKRKCFNRSFWWLT
nr:hypothetical protein [Mycoplasmopsis bovis]